MSFLGFWRRHYRDIPRVRNILIVASRYGFGQLIEETGLQRILTVGRRIISFRRQPRVLEHLSAPERLRRMFEELGPTFIKLGQVLACRPDLLPLEYARELSKLTDSVPPFPFSQAREIIEQDLGAPLDVLFTVFEQTPVAAASIAQVHRATLRDGREVMVKVQRPDIAGVIERDISILRGIAGLIDAHVREMAPYNVPGIVDEFARTISRELDFFIEGSHALQFRRNFTGSKSLYIPEVYAELSSKRVLVMERIEGVRIDDFAGMERLGLDRKEVSKKGADAFFQMVFQDGMFHADPHPGNIFVLSDGSLGLVDFGIIGRVSEENMENFAAVFVALAGRDFNALARQYVAMGFVSEETVDVEKFQRELREDLAELLEPYYGMKIRQIDFATYADRVSRILSRHRLRLPQNLYLMDKALITLEGVLRQLDPDFDYIAAAQPFVTGLLRRQRSPSAMLRAAQRNAALVADMVTMLPRQVRTIMGKLLRGDVNVKVQHVELPQAVRELDKSSNRLSFSIITAAIIVASAIIIHSGQGHKLFGLPVFGLIGYIIAGLFGLWIVIGILRSGQL